MTTEVVQVESKSGYDSAVRRASVLLSEGGLVVFPTETVYGVGACVSATGAVDRLRELKQRPADRAFTVHVGNRDAAAKFVPRLTGLADRFVRKGWPGPLTLILPVKDPMSAPIMADLDGATAAAMYYDESVGLRCPANEVAEALLCSVEHPVVAASANRTGKTPPTTAKAVMKELDGKIDLVIDAGRTRYAKPSTIVRLKDRSYELIREGVYDARTVKRISTLRLLFVCTGNTCRSPMAAGIASDLLAKQFDGSVSELDDFGVAVISAGTSGGFGGASEYAQSAMHRRGIDISGHASATLTVDLIQQADHVFAMTSHHRDTILSMLPSARDRVALLLEDLDVRDPIGGSEEDYEACAQTIEAGVRDRLKEVCP